MPYKDDHIAKFKEDLSLAYLQAVCAVQGIVLEVFKHDSNGTDGILKCYDDEDCEYNIQFQLKSSTLLIDEETTKKYDVAADVHNKLCERKNRITALFVLELNKDRNQWSIMNDNELLIRHKMYFLDYETQSTVNNSSKFRVTIEKNNVIDPKNFGDICFSIYNKWINSKKDKHI